MENDDKGGYDPTGTTKFEDAAFLAMTSDMLIDDLTKLDENFGKVIRLKYDGFKKKEIQELLDLGKKKTQGYVFIDKALYEAEQLLHEYNL